MLLDFPGQFLYRHRFDTYVAMRVLCTQYRCIVCLAVILATIALIASLEQPAVLATFGIMERGALLDVSIR